MNAYEKRRRVMVTVRADMLDLILWNIMEWHHLDIKFECPICRHTEGGKHKEGCDLNRAIMEGERLKNEIPTDPPGLDDSLPGAGDIETLMSFAKGSDSL